MRLWWNTFLQGPKALTIDRSDEFSQIVTASDVPSTNVTDDHSEV